MISSDPTTYANGFIFLATGQGSPISRAVIQEMDDHNVSLLISLSGTLNGNFYSLQPEDAASLKHFIQNTGPTPAVSANRSYANTYRAPDRTPRLSWNPFLPVYNNVNVCTKNDTTCVSEQARRKSNFVRLKQPWREFSVPERLPWTIQ